MVAKRRAWVTARLPPATPDSEAAWHTAAVNRRPAARPTRRQLFASLAITGALSTTLVTAGPPRVGHAAFAPAAVSAGMVVVPGGEFRMGTDDPAFVDASPVHAVRVDTFAISATEVTNAQFEAFVRATGHVTTAERRPRAADFPGVAAANLVTGSIVFTPPARAVPLDTSPSTTPGPTRRGPADVCPPKPSGSMPRWAATTAARHTPPRRALEVRLPSTSSKGAFPTPTPRPTGLPAPRR
jgi:formylglycine-generating enzyme required for sulfatase activity